MEAIDSNNGLNLWTTNIQSRATCCIGRTLTDHNSKVYITSVISNIVTIIQAYVTRLGFNIISETTFAVPNNPEMYCISTYDDSKYIISSEHEVSIYNDSNKLLSKTLIGNIDLDRTYRLILKDPHGAPGRKPKHVDSYILVALNGINTVNINGFSAFISDDIYAGIFIITFLKYFRNPLGFLK